MGYTTRFQGAFEVTPPITVNDLREYQDSWDGRTPDTEGSPSAYNQWALTNESKLRWDGGEKFYEYIPWLMYLVDFFFEPRGYKLNGDVIWEGDEDDDVGLIRVIDSKVHAYAGVTDPSERT